MGYTSVHERVGTPFALQPTETETRERISQMTTNQPFAATPDRRFRRTESRAYSQSRYILADIIGSAADRPGRKG